MQLFTYHSTVRRSPLHSPLRLHNRDPVPPRRYRPTSVSRHQFRGGQNSGVVRLPEQVADFLEEIDESDARSAGGVVDVAGDARPGGGEQIEPDDVGDECKISGLFPISEDFWSFPFFRSAATKRGMTSRVRAVGVLPRSEDVEVSQPDGFNVVTPGEGFHVKFTRQFGRGVGRGGFEMLSFLFRHDRGVPGSGAAGGGVDNTRTPGLAGFIEEDDGSGHAASCVSTGLATLRGTEASTPGERRLQYREGRCGRLERLAAGLDEFDPVAEIGEILDGSGTRSRTQTYLPVAPVLPRDGNR